MASREAPTTAAIFELRQQPSRQAPFLYLMAAKQARPVAAGTPPCTARLSRGRPSAAPADAATAPAGITQAGQTMVFKDDCRAETLDTQGTGRA